MVIKNLKLNIGDVFTIPMKENWEDIVYGQIVKCDETVITVIIFDGVYKSIEKNNIKKIISQEPLFLFATLDAHLYHEMWKIIGCYPVLSKFKWPIFKIGLREDDDIEIKDYDDNIIRRATKEEWDKLFYKSRTSPQNVVDYLAIWYGYKKMNHSVNKEFLYKNLVNSCKGIDKTPKPFWRKYFFKK